MFEVVTAGGHEWKRTCATKANCH